MTRAIPQSPGLASASAPSLFTDYSVSAPSHDEAFEAPGVSRLPWQGVIRFLDTLGHQELHRRWTQARQMLHENGVTYNVYGDPGGMDRPWELDAIPWVTPPPRMGRPENRPGATRQSPERRTGGCLRPATSPAPGPAPPGVSVRQCRFSAALPWAATPPGWVSPSLRCGPRPWPGWAVVRAGHRRQNPAGTGYALENRLIVSRLLQKFSRTVRCSAWRSSLPPYASYS